MWDLHNNDAENDDDNADNDDDGWFGTQLVSVGLCNLAQTATKF